MAKEYAKGFYSSKAWQDCREAYAKSRGYLCEECELKGRLTPGEIVHHIEELTPMNIHRPEITLSFKNLELLCRECHAQMHSTREKARRYSFDDSGRIFLKKNNL